MEAVCIAAGAAGRGTNMVAAEKDAAKATGAGTRRCQDSFDERGIVLVRSQYRTRMCIHWMQGGSFEKRKHAWRTSVYTVDAEFTHIRISRGATTPAIN